KIGPRIGGLVAMKTNGEILAWVSTPSFNPNPFAHGTASNIWTELKDHPFKPLRNKVIQDHFAPGSTLKPIIAAAALQEGEITASTIISAPGQMRFGNRVYHDSIPHGHGNITVVQAIERSSNIFFYKMGIELGIDVMSKYAALFNLGKKTDIRLPSEVPGNFPTKEWKLKVTGEAWQPGENLSNAIGQGFVLVNLLQMAMAYNAIGTDGKLYRPFIVKKVINESNELVEEFGPELIRDITLESEGMAHIDAKHLKTIREGLRRVANGDRGTARWWKIPGVQYAGKTATSQVLSFSADDIYKKCETRPLAHRHHGSFIAYAPPENPEITVAALTEHSCHGNTGSTPVVRDVIQAYFAKFHPEKLQKSAPAPKAE